MGNRIIYMAIGDFPDAEMRERVQAQMKDFDTILRAGRPADEVVRVLPEPIRPAAWRATLAIRRFEKAVGVECGAQVSNASSPLAGIPPQRSISLENRDGCLFDDEVADLAREVAAELAGLLSALGAANVFIGNID